MANSPKAIPCNKSDKKGIENRVGDFTMVSVKMLHKVVFFMLVVALSVCLYTKADLVAAGVHQFSRDDTGADDKRCDEESDNGPGVHG